MQDNSSIHRLARPNVKSGRIKFIHKDNTEHVFTTCVNDMTGSRLSWFNNDPPDIGESLAYIKSVFADIRKKSIKVIECIGDF